MGGCPLRWTWDPAKNAVNWMEHGLDFETAQFVFDDPLSMTRSDPYAEEARWRTMGRIGSVVVMVIHTWPEAGEGVGRIISARKATRHERKAYDEGEY